MSELADRVSLAVAPRYVVERALGHGGTATVFLAQDRKLGRPVALKVLRPEIAAALGEGRFLREVDIGANLTHPHILPILDSGEADGLLYFTMPYVDGESLHDRLRREKQLPLDETVRITTEVASALSYAHERGILHRDIKPGNILLEDGQAVVADFGLAKVKAARDALTVTSGASTEVGIAVGTPHYMSPEQWEADSHIDGRSDVYSLACVLYEMLTGEPPFTGPDIQSIRSKACGQPAPSLQIIRGTIPRRLDAVYRRALEKIPADRYASARDFARALERAAQPPTPLQRLVDRVAVWPRWLRAVTASGSALGAGALAYALLAHVPDGEPPRHRVVVDLFENRTGDSTKSWLGASVQSWLSTELSRAGLDVVPTVTAYQVARAIRDPARRPRDGLIAALARETDAGLVVTGALERQGSRIRLSAQIVSAATGQPLRTAIRPSTAAEDSIDLAVRPLLDDIAGAIYVSLEDRLPHMAESPGPAPSPEAWGQFAEALHRYLDEHWDDAREHFLQAYQLDSTFVSSLLYAALAYSNANQWREADSVLTIVARHREALSAYDQHWLDYRRAMIAGDRDASLQAIRRAAGISPRSKAGYNLALEAWETRHLGEARAALDSLDPEGPVFRDWQHYWTLLTLTLHALGAHEDELRAARRAQALHPGDARHVVREIAALAALRRVGDLLPRLDAIESAGSVDVQPLLRESAEELREHGEPAAARRVFDRAVAWYERQPPGVRGTTSVAAEQALVLCGLERWSEALQIIGPLTDSFPADFRYLGQRGVIEAHLGERAAATRTSRRLAALESTYLFGQHTAERARIAAALGDAGAATALLEQAFDAGYPFNLGIHRNPDFQRLWGYAPFATLMTPR